MHKVVACCALSFFVLGMKQLARLFTALFLCQTLAQPAQAVSSTDFYKPNRPVALSERAQAAINSGVVGRSDGFAEQRLIDGANLTNTGTLAGHTVTANASQTLTSNGVIQGLGVDSSISLNARDIVLRTRIQTSSNSIDGPNGTSTGSRTSAERIATLSADSITLAALNNIALSGASVQATKGLSLTAGADITVQAVQTGYTLNIPVGGNADGRSGYYQLDAATQQLSSLKAGNNLNINAGGDASFKGTNAEAGQDLSIDARNITIEAAKERLAIDQQGILQNGYIRAASTDETLVGANFTAGNNLTLTAKGDQAQGSGNITLTAAQLNAQDGQTRLLAGNNVLIQNATTQHSSELQNVDNSSSLFSRSTSVLDNNSQSSAVQGSSVQGNTVLISAGQDLQVKGSNVVSDTGTTLIAKNNIGIEAATSTSSSETHKVESSTGWFSGGGIGISYGTVTTTTDAQQQGSIQSGTQERSTVGSVGGSVNLKAGNALKVSGSDVQAGQDIIATGASVQIDPGLDHFDATTQTKIVTDALTLAVGGSVVSAAQTLQSLNTAATNTKNKRMQALAAAAQALAVAQAAAAVAADGGSVSVSLTANHSESTTKQTDSSTSNAGSNLSAGRNVQITATGTDATNPNSGNVNLIGSSVSAGNNVQLKASKDIFIVSAQDTEAHQTDHSDWTVGAGVGVAASGSGGASLGVTANAGLGVATQKSQASTQQSSHITAGNNLSVTSGRDTNIQGGVLSADSVSADVGRNLNIQSQQDTASASAKSASASVSATVGYGVSVSASLAYAKSQNDFASVDEQSGIRAGDGGFNVNVKGNTDLKGGVISSTQAAVDAGKNSLTTATLSSSDIANHSTADGIGLSGGVSYSAGGSDKDPAKSGTGAKEVGGMKLSDQGNAGAKREATSMGAASESDSSTTRSGISGATLTIGTKTTQTDQGQTATDSSGKAINTNATTGIDTTAKLAKPSSLEDIQAQVQIVQSFGSQASKAVGDYAAQQMSKANQLNAQAAQTADPQKKADLQAQADAINANWGDYGTLRIAAHAAIGGLTGGTDGAVGAATGTITAPAMAQALNDAGITGPAASAITALASTAVGAAAGGTAGAASAGNEVVNNYLNHNRPSMLRLSEKEKYDAAAVGCANGDKAACGTRDEFAALSVQRDRELAQACAGQTAAYCNDQKSKAIVMGNKVFTTEGGYSYANSPTPSPLNTATIGPVSDPRTGTFNDTAARSTAEGVLLETGNLAVVAVVGAGSSALLGAAVTAQTVRLTGGVAAVSTGKWVGTAFTGSVLGAGVNYLTDPDASFASLAISSAAGAVGGTVKLGANAGAGLANQWVATTTPALVTQMLGTSTGKIISIPSNQAVDSHGGTSWWNSPIQSCGLYPRKPC